MPQSNHNYVLSETPVHSISWQATSDSQQKPEDTRDACDSPVPLSRAHHRGTAELLR